MPGAARHHRKHENVRRIFGVRGVSIMASPQSSVGVIWEGSFFVYHSFALVNREMVLGLVDDERIDLGLIPYEPHQFGPEVDPRFEKIQELLGRRPNRIDFHIRHRWPPSFEPAEGRFILIQPWEFGSLPIDWVGSIQQRVAEVWAPSNYVRQVYIQSGINPENVTVIPYGINPDIFYPGNSSLKLNTSRRFKFLFVGGTILRKGIDVLLQAYTTEFNSDDDVCLVIKDFGTKSFYRGSTWGQKIEEIRRRPNAPEIIYFTEDIPEREMGDLYRACDCLVHPYRGEGFGLPMAEAMACGLAVIATGWGACLDFCNSENSYLIESELKVASEKRVGDIQTVSYPYWAEPNPDHLRYLMRHVYEHAEEAKSIGFRASRNVLSSLTWSKASAIAVSRLLKMKESDNVTASTYIWVPELSSTCHQPVEDLANDCLTKGVTLYSEGEKDGAIQFLTKAISLAPELHVAKYNLATIYSDIGEYESGFKYAIEYIKACSDDGEAWSLLGNILVNLGDLFTAKLAYGEAIAHGYTSDELSQISAEIRRATQGTSDLFSASWYRNQVMPLLRIAPNEGPRSHQLNGTTEILRRVYHGFEGNEAVIRERQRALVSYFRGCSKVLDIGCGRGVFLELLREEGIPARGIDLDKRMVEIGRSRGLDIEVASAIEFLSLNSDKYDGMFLGHIIEHFDATAAFHLLHLCMQRLEDGGTIVIVTPNFSEPRVALEGFWLDLSHVRPYPEKLLRKILVELGAIVIRSGTLDGTDNMDLVVVARKSSACSKPRLNVIWTGPVYDPSGYGDEIRNMVVNLPDNRFDLRIIAPPGSRREGDLISGAMREKLLSFERSTIYPEDAIVVQHVPAWLFTTELRGRVNIGRTMFETNGLPSDWVAKCNQMDEVWVPATFNADTFSRAGVDQSKIRVVPGGIDPDVFSPSASPLSIPRARGFKFLSNFDWSSRKGWDVLLEAYVSEFNRSEDVTLVLKVSRNRAFTPRPVMYNILEFMVNHLHKDPDNAPNIVVIEGVIPDADLPGLYTACDAFVLPSRGEGWGRPYMEAMSCGLPVIGTKWSGNLDFMNDSNSFLIDIEGLQQVTPSSDTALWCYLGQYWAQPSVEHLRTLMRQVFENTELSKSKGRKAREDIVANWTWQRVASIVEKELLKFA